MAAIALKLTDAGLAAVQAASGSDPTIVAELGLTASPFDYAPTLTALPGEFKRLNVTSGVAAAPNITHLTVYDVSADVWSATGMGLFLEDGTLFAAHTGAEPFLAKSGLAFALLAFDIAFEADLAANIAYGNATFVYPPATEGTKGVAELATQGETDAGTDDERIVTPRKLAVRLSSLLTPIVDSINSLTGSVGSIMASLGNYALKSVEIVGGGLASGGGNLTANRTITVTEASAAQITEGTAGDVVVTPRRLGPITMLLAQDGYIRFFGFQIVWGRFTANANGTTAVLFAQPFQTACFSVVASGVISGDAGSQDNPPAVVGSSITKDGFSVFSADDGPTTTCYIGAGT